MVGRLEGKVAIVTGGGSGFGAGIAAKFVQEGDKVLICDLSRENGTKVAHSLGCGYQLADVTKRSYWEALLKKAIDSFDDVDIVVNNAGTTYSNKPSETVTDDEFGLCFNVNVKSIYLSSSVLLPYFMENNRQGCFIQIASTAGIRPRPGLTWYNASRAAVSNATKTVAVEYAHKRIRFNAVCPAVGPKLLTNDSIFRNRSRPQLQSLLPQPSLPAAEWWLNRRSRQ
jgi:NAD(P)-dependent dehydrogenase (short-subunit alcohol dehydrogenase family)